MSVASRITAIVGATACILHVSSAAAEPSAWLSFGGGYGLKHNDITHDLNKGTALSFALGVGSDPTKSFVLGGMFRSTSYLGLGTDIGLAARIASGGFVRGDWGLAFEIGPTLRTFGHGEFGRWPISTMITGGLPWGLQLGVGGDFFKVGGGDANARGFTAVLEFDLLRFTVMRQGSTDKWWENVAPAGGRIKPSTTPSDAPTLFPSGDGPTGPSSGSPQSRVTRPMGPLPGLLW